MQYIPMKGSSQVKKGKGHQTRQWGKMSLGGSIADVFPLAVALVGVVMGTGMILMLYSCDMSGAGGGVDVNRLLPLFVYWGLLGRG